MRIAHIVLASASAYETKSQAIDRDALSSRHEIIETDFEGATASGADVAHVYGGEGFEAPRATRFAIPFLASAPPSRSRLAFRRRATPAVLVSPLDNLPEAVGEAWFGQARTRDGGALPRVGTYRSRRAGVANMIEQSLARIQRFREDVAWEVFDEPPSPEDLHRVDAWCDPATSDGDFDGFVAEALVAGKIVVASRTPINTKRLEQGRTGLLVPPSDPNELTHAILSALFKSEVAEKKIECARQTAGKFRPRQRLRVLEALYESLIR